MVSVSDTGPEQLRCGAGICMSGVMFFVSVNRLVRSLGVLFSEGWSDPLSLSFIRQRKENGVKRSAAI